MSATIADPTLEDYADDRLWLAWQTEARTGTAKPTKVPYSPHGGKGRVDDPKTWGTRPEAARAAGELPKPYRDGGVGIVLGADSQEGLGGIDLDTCLDAEGHLETWAAEVVDRFASYTEISPSGKGLKTFFRYRVADRPRLAPLMGEGKHSRLFKRGTGEDHPPAIELHLSNRYFTVTGDRSDDSPAGLRLVDEEDIVWLVTVAGPAFAPKAGGSRGNAKSGARDKSRSAIAADICLQLRRAGKTYEEMCAALRADETTRDWVKEKGEPRHERELRRIWQRAADIINAPEIAQLNEQYAMVLVGGTAAILHEFTGFDGRPTWELVKLNSFKAWMGNRHLTLGQKTLPLGPHWLSHPLRRQYQGIIFAPGRDDPAYYNVWRGFACLPKEGDCSLFLDHVQVNVCRRDKKLFMYVIGWCADIVQHPAKKIGTALAFRGEQGVGKTLFGKIIGSLLGDHYVSVADPRYITGRFNSHLTSCLLLHADEGFWAGDHTAEGKLKDLVTGEYHLIELKGIEAFKVRNYVRLLVTGNPRWVVPAGMRERRFAVLEMGLEHQEDHAYFAAIEKQMNEGGREALLYHLLNFDLSQVNLRVIPKTAALLEQKIESLTPEQAWWLDVLTSGRLPGRQGSMVSKRALFDAYIAHANKVGVRRRTIETALGMFLRRAVPGLRTWESQPFVDFDGKEYTSNAYSFPLIGTCRKYFCEMIDQEIEWDGREEWQ